MVVNPAFWRGKRVFITGHTGFKGGWLSLWLSELKAQVFGYALAPDTEPSLFDLAAVADVVDDTIADIRDLDILSDAVGRARPDIVFHLAAQPLVRESYHDPVGTYSTNVLGTVHVLEAVRRCGSVRAVVNVTSDKCYLNREWVWGYRESDRLGGFDPYSNSKACSELVTEAYRHAFFEVADGPQPAAVASARAGNVIGGGDWADDRLVPDAVRAFMGRRGLQIRNPASTRPWQHVLEPLSGYLMLAERLCSGDPSYVGAWNFGPDPKDCRPVEEVVTDLCRRWGDDAAWARDDAGYAEKESGFLALDCSKARFELGWDPLWDLDTALRVTVEWYRAFERRQDLKTLTRAQIDDYQKGRAG